MNHRLFFNEEGKFLANICDPDGNVIGKLELEQNEDYPKTSTGKKLSYFDIKSIIGFDN